MEEAQLRSSIDATAREGNVETLRGLMDIAALRGPAFVSSLLHPSGMSPLMKAALAGSPECIELLLRRGAAVDHTNDINCTALHYATWRGFLRSMQVLLEHGACVDVLDNSGNTPMHDACNGAHSVASLSLLLRYGSRACRIRNKSNKLPVELLLHERVIVSGDNKACARLLLDHGGLPRDRAACWTGPTWQWLHDALDARARAAEAALLLLGFRRFKRSAVMAGQDMEIVRIIAREVWALRRVAAVANANKH